MSLESIVSVIALISGDQQWQIEFATEPNASSPAQNEIKSLTTGANTITPPSGGTAPNGVIIVPPAANTVALTLKGVTGDTGVGLHLTHPSYIPLASTTATFVLTAAAPVVGVRLLWS
jgi:hypothetical protein